MSKSTCTKEADTKDGEHFEFGYQRQRYVLKVTVTGVVKEVTKYKENQPCCLGVELRSPPPKRFLYPAFELLGHHLPAKLFDSPASVCGTPE